MKILKINDMRRVLLLLAVVLPLVVSAQTKGIGELEKVVETTSNKSLLYTNAQQWASANDPTCKKKIEVQDNDNASIVVKIELNNNSSANSLTKYLTYKFRFSVKIDCKDGKYRRIINNPSVLVGSDNNVVISYLSTSDLEVFQTELEAVERISTSNFQQILDWELLKVVDLLASTEKQITDLNEQAKNLGDTKNEKKEKKRIGYKIERLNANNAVLKEAISRWNNAILEVIVNLDKTLSQNNDF